VYPAAQFVMFVDGDCEVVEGWIETAEAELAARSDVAAVCGRLRERYPERSLYNRLCDLEWNAAVGEVNACGGIAMYRIGDFLATGGFDKTVTAGEEPELCLRLRRRGRKILRIPVEMALHDAAMLRLGQWWKRQVRGGYGGLDIVTRFDRDGNQTAFARQLRSARLWGIGWPVAVMLGAAAGFILGGTLGSAIGAGIAVLPALLQVLRLARKARRNGSDRATAIGYGALTLLSKWASLLGQWQYWRDRRGGQPARRIDKDNGKADPSTPVAALPSGEVAQP
jgi:cellulose synthase/poly-beta-1,6-N-acetylglucosamine synthase-like glycosyltransferase